MFQLLGTKPRSSSGAVSVPNYPASSPTPPISLTLLYVPIGRGDCWALGKYLQRDFDVPALFYVCR